MTAVTPPTPSPIHISGMDYTLSNHAKRVLIEREIPIAWVERTLAEPELRHFQQDNPAIERRFRRIPEFGGRVLRVVVNVSTQTNHVVSVFFDRSKKGKL